MIMMIFTDDMLVCVCVIRSDSMIERCLSPSFPPLLSSWIELMIILMIILIITTNNNISYVYVCICTFRSDSDSMSERCLSPSFPPLLSTNTSLDSTMLAATDLSWLGQLTNSAASPGLYQRGLRINDDHDDDDDDDDDTSFVYSIRWRCWLKFKICKLSQILKCHRILLQKTRIGKIQNCSEFCETETKTAVFCKTEPTPNRNHFFSNRAHL